MGSRPNLISEELALENGLDPKNPDAAEYGLGCADERTTCLDSSMRVDLAFAGFPQSKKTIGLSLAERPRMTWLVNSSQPWP